MPRKASSEKKRGNKKSTAKHTRNAAGPGALTPAPRTQNVERQIGQFSEAGKPPLIKK